MACNSCAPILQKCSHSSYFSSAETPAFLSRAASDVPPVPCLRKTSRTSSRDAPSSRRLLFSFSLRLPFTKNLEKSGAPGATGAPGAGARPRSVARRGPFTVGAPRLPSSARPPKGDRPGGFKDNACGAGEGRAPGSAGILPASGSAAVRATPAARRLAKEAGLDLAAVVKKLNLSGPVTEKDIKRFLET